MQSDLVNGKAHYISRGGKDEISYSRNGSWVVGRQVKKATGYRALEFRVRSTADCPDVSGWKWQYADTPSSGWSNADKWFRISCAD